MATNVHLTAELEQFAKACVESGRYNNVSEVLREGLRLLQEREARFRSFNAMLDEVRRDADRNGDFSLEEVLAELDEIVETAE